MCGPLLRRGGVRGAADLGLQLRFTAETEGRFLPAGAAKTTLCRQRIHTNVFFRSLVFLSRRTVSSARFRLSDRMLTRQKGTS